MTASTTLAMRSALRCFNWSSNLARLKAGRWRTGFAASAAFGADASAATAADDAASSAYTPDAAAVSAATNSNFFITLILS